MASRCNFPCFFRPVAALAVLKLTLSSQYLQATAKLELNGWRYNSEGPHRCRLRTASGKPNASRTTTADHSTAVSFVYLPITHQPEVLRLPQMRASHRCLHGAAGALRYMDATPLDRTVQSVALCAATWLSPLYDYRRFSCAVNKYRSYMCPTTISIIIVLDRSTAGA